MQAISLYDLSGIMLRPWARAGWDCIAVDILVKPHTDKYGVKHVKADVMGQEVETLVSRSQILFAFPPCDHLAISGLSYFKSKGPKIREEAMELVYRVPELGYRYRIPWMLENPVSVISTEWRKFDYRFDPYEFGGYLPPDHKPEAYIIPARDAYRKATCLWYGGGFLPPRRKPVYVRDGRAPQFAYLGGASRRTKYLRSLTPEGFAIAVYEVNKRIWNDAEKGRG